MLIAVVVPNYNSAQLVGKAVQALLVQLVDAPDAFRVVVVDDGSTDGSADRLEEQFGERITLIRLGSNRGRSSARNAGAAATDAEALLFIDSDCIPLGTGLVQAHLKVLAAGCDVSFGEIRTPGTGFWDRLQRDANRWRLRSFRAGQHWTFTTQNVAVRRRIFDALCADSTPSSTATASRTGTCSQGLPTPARRSASLRRRVSCTKTKCAWPLPFRESCSMRDSTRRTIFEIAIRRSTPP